MIHYVRVTREDVNNLKQDDDPLAITDDDVLWLMRMCVGEGGMDCSRNKAAAMMWSMINRWFLHPGRKHWPSFKHLLRRFSQPINPRWARGGDLAEKYKNTRFADPKRLKRRDKISNLKESEIPIDVSNAVMCFQFGTLFPPEILTRTAKSRISNWASLQSTPRRFPWGVDIDGDWFFEDERLRQGVVAVVDL